MINFLFQICLLKFLSYPCFYGLIRLPQCQLLHRLHIKSFSLYLHHFLLGQFVFLLHCKQNRTFHFHNLHFNLNFAKPLTKALPYPFVLHYSPNFIYANFAASKLILMILFFLELGQIPFIKSIKQYFSTYLIFHLQNISLHRPFRLSFLRCQLSLYGNRKCAKSSCENRCLLGWTQSFPDFVISNFNQLDFNLFLLYLIPLIKFFEFNFWFLLLFLILVWYVHHKTIFVYLSLYCL